MRHTIAAFFAITSLLLMVYAGVSNHSDTRVHILVDWLKIEVSYEKNDR